MKSMVFKIVGNFHIVIAGSPEPNEADWSAYMNAVRGEEQNGADFAKMRTIVFSAGGGPQAKQRKEINEYLLGRATPVAIVTSSAIMRGVVTVLAWLNPLARAFPPDNVAAALDFLGASAIEANKVWAEAKELQSSADSPPSKSISLDSPNPPGTGAR